MNNSNILEEKLNKLEKGGFCFTIDNNNITIVTNDGNELKKTIIFENNKEIKTIKTSFDNENYNYIITKYEPNGNSKYTIIRKTTLDKLNNILNEDIYINENNLKLKINNNKLYLFNKDKLLLEIKIEKDKYILNFKNDEIVINNKDKEKIYINGIILNNLNDNIMSLSKSISYKDELCSSLYHINLINLINELEEKINYMKISIEIYNEYKKLLENEEILNNKLLEYINNNFEEETVLKPKKKVRK